MTIYYILTSIKSFYQYINKFTYPNSITIESGMLILPKESMWKQRVTNYPPYLQSGHSFDSTVCKLSDRLCSNLSLDTIFQHNFVETVHQDTIIVQSIRFASTGVNVNMY